MACPPARASTALLVDTAALTAAQQAADVLSAVPCVSAVLFAPPATQKAPR